ncbi:MAG: hypothetical protein K2F76_01600, partial [Duncaniella dubosii]|nr:hypothetical protein [Duncaniella dubosii]
MKGILKTVFLFTSLPAAFNCQSSPLTQEPDTLGLELQEVVISERRTLGKLRGRATNTEVISASDLKRAACCNLGESFTTNPSVDVSYSDAATGAR